MQTLSIQSARRIALRALGLADGRPDAAIRRDVRHLRKVTDRLGIVQLDSVNVLLRAHAMPFWSRVGAHDHAARDHLLWHSGELTEGWAHVASLTPVAHWRLLHHRREAFRAGDRRAAFERDHPGFIERILEEVTDAGPSSVTDLVDAGARSGPWWGNPRGKRALQHLFLGGELAVHHRTGNFVTVYDRTDRVLPAGLLEAEPPGRDEARRELLLIAARAHGIGTAADLADHHRQAIRPARRVLAELATDGALREVRVAGWGNEPVYLDPRASAPRELRGATLVSPFDPVMWFRDRTERLFDLHYRIEIYVPEAQRRHGYYVLPFLLRDRFVARVDLKADRRARRLLVRAAFAEPDVDRVEVARALTAELHHLAAWLDLDEVVVERRGDLADRLRAASA
jgi:uncharacterized protein